MLTPTAQPINHFKNSFEPPTEYQLHDVQLEIPNDHKAIFTARAAGPVGATAWVRAWISNEPQGTLTEAEIADVPVGDKVTLTVVLERDATPEMACMRIESEQFATKHTVHFVFDP